MKLIRPCHSVGFFGAVNMQMSRIGLGFAIAMMGLSVTCSKLTESFKAFSRVPPIWTQPSRYKSKPNKVSQAKRRKYVRQGRG